MATRQNNTRKRGIPIPPEEREMMKAQIQVNIRHGVKPTITQAQLQISDKTYYKLKDELAVDAATKHYKRTNRVLYDYVTRIEGIFNDLDEQYLKAQNPIDKARILSQEEQLMSNFFDRMQRAGFLPQRTENVNVQGAEEVLAFMRRVYERRRKRAIESIAAGKED